jgi:hypothetical protein
VGSSIARFKVRDRALIDGGDDIWRGAIEDAPGAIGSSAIRAAIIALGDRSQARDPQR